MIVFPKNCNEDNDRLNFMTELKEELRLWHNQQAEDKNWVEAKRFFDSKFYGKSIEVEKLINLYALYIWDSDKGAWWKQRGIKTGGWNPDLTLLDYVPDRDVNIFDPPEDYTTYVEEDPSNWFDPVTATKITITNMPKNDDSWIVKDMGIDHFDGDFEHLVDGQFDSGENASGAGGWAVTNYLNDWRAQIIDIKYAFQVAFYGPDTAPRIYLEEASEGAEYTDFYDASSGTPYYFKVKRDEAIGSHGTIFNYIYSNSQRSTLLDTLSIAIHGQKTNFRWVYGVLSENRGWSQAWSGFFQNLDLQEATDVTTEFIKTFRRGRRS
jgi:hypothetical protein